MPADTNSLTNWLPTVISGTILGVLAQRVIRLGQKDQTKINQAATKINEAAEHRQETQQALDAQKSIAAQYKDMAAAKDATITSQQGQIDSLTDLVTALRALVQTHIDASAAQTEQAIDQARPEPPPGS